MSHIMSKIMSFVTGRRRLVYCGAVVIPAILVGSYTVGGREQGVNAEKELAASATEPPDVRVIRPQLRNIIRTVGQPSFVEAYERSSVYPKMTAYIEKWNVDIGDRVKKGEVLATLFVPELVEDWGTKKETVQLDKERVDLATQIVEVAKADVDAAKARLDEAKAILEKFHADVVRWDSEVKRLKREVKNGVVDPQVLLESENQHASSTAAESAAKATILKATAELESKKAVKLQRDIDVRVAIANWKVAQSEEKRLKALVGYLELPAPFDGVVTVRNANTFDFVLPATGDPTAMNHSRNLAPSGSAAPIYVVERTDIVRIFVDIPEHDANFVQKGNKASVQIKGFGDFWIPATVTRTSWSLNVKSRTLRAEIDLNNTGTKILPGMYAYGKVIIERPSVWALPVTALASMGESSYYWTHQRDRDGKEHAVRVDVQTGVSDGDWIEVTNRQATGSADSWVPIDGSEQVLASEDLGLLTQGEAVRIAPSASKEKLAVTTNKE